MSLIHPHYYYADKYRHSFMRMADEFGSNSPAGDKKVGCLIYFNNHTVSYGLNGRPSGVSCEETRYPDGANKPDVRHAEWNAIQKLVDDGCEHLLDGAVVFVTLAPCEDCAELLIKHRVKKVYYTREYKCTNGLCKLWLTGIQTQQIEEVVYE